MKLWISLNEDGPFQEKDGYRYDIVYQFINENKLSFDDCFYMILENESYIFKYEITPFKNGDYHKDQMFIENKDKDDFDEALLVKQDSIYIRGKKEMILHGTVEDTSSCGCCDATFSITKDGFCLYDDYVRSVDSFLNTMKSVANIHVYNECVNVLKKIGKINE